MRNFSEFLSAVKPRERTDQYLILAALFLLNAHRCSVTVREVNKLLELHLNAKAPQNTNACMRAYKAYVSPEQGHPIRWSLTAEGVKRLEVLSGLSLFQSDVEGAFGSDVGVVCALEFPELSAVLSAFGGANMWTEIGETRFSHIYREIRLPMATGGHLRVVATSATSMGLTAAAIASTQLILQYRPRLVMMVGIAAGTRNGGKQFGDVLVADPSVDYNSGKVAVSNGIREFQPDPYPIGLHPRVRSVLQKYRGTHSVFDEIRKAWAGKLPPAVNRIHVGPVGAADQVIDDANRVLEIQKNWRKLIGVEMETYGVYRAVHEAPDPKPRVISFKSVCDFAAEKSDSWQEYAAFVAARFAFEFLRREWNSLWPTQELAATQTTNKT